MPNMAFPKDALSRICGGIIHKSSIYSDLPKRLEIFVSWGGGEEKAESKFADS